MQKQKLLILTLAAIILAAGIFLRYWHLDIIPPGIQYDEAYNGIDAIRALETHTYRLFYPDNFGREGLHLNVTALFVKLFGTESFSIRLANATWGSLTLIGFLLLLRQLRFSWFTSLMGTFMLSFSFWHLNFSRTAYRAIMVPFLITWIWYFFLKGVNSKHYKYIYFALSGLLLGLGFHTYIAFRVAPIIIVLLALAYLVLQKGFFKAYWKHAIVFICGALLTALPIFIYFFNHQDDLTGRANAVSVFNAPGMSFPEALSKSLSVHVGAFFVHGDMNQRHNHNGQPLIPTAWGILLLVGFAISLKEIFHTLVRYFKYLRASKTDNQRAFTVTKYFYPSFLGQTAFWIMLIPGVLSIEGIPHALRIIGAIPATFLLCALPLEFIYHLYEKIKHSATLSLKPWRWNIMRLSLGGLTAVVLATGITQAYVYFDIWAKDPKTLGAFERKLFDLGLLIKQLPVKEKNYLITTSSIAISQDKRTSSLKTTEYLGYPNIKQYQFMHPLEGRFDVQCDNAQIVFSRS